MIVPREVLGELIPASHSGRAWEITLAEPLITSNDRRSWAAHHRIRCDVRDRALWLLRVEKIPRLQYVHIFGIVHATNMRRRDAGNWYPTCKVIIDAMVAEGILPEDDQHHVVGPDPRVRRRKKPGFSVQIWELNGPPL